MPTIVFFAIAYQVQNIKWRYLFLALAAVNLLVNIYNLAWATDFYSAVIVLLLFSLNPCFLTWWERRNSRDNPISFLLFSKETYLIAKYNKFKLFCWTIFLIVTISAVFWYVGYTGNVLLGWLLCLFLILYSLNHLFNLILPPEWFLHDINTRYVYLSILIAWFASNLIYQKLGYNFIMPMLFAMLFCLIGLYRLHHDIRRFLIPGCAIICADIVWQMVRFFQGSTGDTLGFMTTECILIVSMLIGIIWLLKRPGIFPLIYLAFFQLFRFSGFTYQAIDRIANNELSTHEAAIYLLYLVCWMYLVPLFFWFIGLRQQVAVMERHANPRPMHFANTAKV